MISESLRTICFIDMADSTELTEKNGNQAFSRLRDEFLVAGQLLATSCGGTHKKSMGDAHLVEFDSLEPALHYCMQMQQFYAPTPCLEQNPIRIRCAVGTGVVEETKLDVFGPAVNETARVEKETERGTVWTNAEFVSSLQRAWGLAKTKDYFESRGTFGLKGIDGEHELFTFNWEKYVVNNPEYGLGGLLHGYLENILVINSNLDSQDFGGRAQIVWPIVPRDIVTAIHRGQIEIIRLIAKLGWDVKVLLADCGANDNPPREYSMRFAKAIEEYAQFRGLKSLEFQYMSDLYRPDFEGYAAVHTNFKRVLSDLTLKDLLDINHKKYAEDVQAAIKGSATLDFLRPALTIAAVLYLAQETGHKCVAVAGVDERIQWERAHDIPGSANYMGALLHPVFETQGGFQQRQDKNWPIWYSSEKMVEDMERSNLASWFVGLHLFPSVFPDTKVTIGKTEILISDLTDIRSLEEKLRPLRNDLAKLAFSGTMRLPHNSATSSKSERLGRGARRHSPSK